MKLRNILAASLCAATMTLGGCDKTQSAEDSKNLVERQCKEFYTPATKYTVRDDKKYPIDAQVRYSGDEDGFYLSKKFKNNHAIIVYFDHNSMYVRLKDLSGKKEPIFLIDWSPEFKDGVDEIENISIGESCYDFQHPKCDESDIKKANELFFQALKDLRFREHLGYFKDKPSKDILDGWN